MSHHDETHDDRSGEPAGRPGSVPWLRWLSSRIAPPPSTHVEPLTRCVEQWIADLVTARDAYLIVELGGRFVQVLVLDGTYLRAELVGDHYLSGSRAYTDEQRASLARFGWLLPDVEFADHPEIPAEERSKNYWHVWEPADPMAAAALLALTLVLVLGLADGNVHLLDFQIGCPTLEPSA